MKVSFFLAVLSLFSPTLSASRFPSKSCEIFTDSVKIEAVSQRLSAKAGDALELPLVIRTKNPKSFSSWNGYVRILFRFFNAIPGSSEITQIVELQKDGKTIPVPETIITRLASNLFGEYRLKVQLEAFGSRNSLYPEGSYCLKDLVIPVITLQVDNDPDSVDIDPPQILRVSFSHASYRLEESAVLSVRYQDESPLCGFHSSCVPTSAPFLIRFENQQTKAVGTFRVRHDSLSESSPGVGTIKIPLRQVHGLREKGKWKLTFLAIEDVFRNLSSDLPPVGATFTLTD